MLLRTIAFSAALFLSGSLFAGQYKLIPDQTKKMYVIVLKYIQPLEKVDEWVPPHVEFLKECYSRSQFIFSGPQSPRVGGLILANVESLDAVWELIKKDPFYTHQIAEYNVIEFIPWMYDERFDTFIKD